MASSCQKRQHANKLIARALRFAVLVAFAIYTISLFSLLFLSDSIKLNHESIEQFDALHVRKAVKDEPELAESQLLRRHLQTQPQLEFPSRVFRRFPSGLLPDGGNRQLQSGQPLQFPSRVFRRFASSLVPDGRNRQLNEQDRNEMQATKPLSYPASHDRYQLSKMNEIRNKNLLDRELLQHAHSLHVDECKVDPFGFGPVLDKITIADEAAHAHAPKVLCIVNTHEAYHQSRARAVYDTWGSKCDGLVFASSKTDPDIGAVQINHTDYSYNDLWNKHRETLRYIYRIYKNEYDWFVKADDDTYVIVENLKALIGQSGIRSAHDGGSPLHIGNPVSAPIGQDGWHSDNGLAFHDQKLLKQYLNITGGKMIFNVGGAGYVMNSHFLRTFIAWMDRPECAPTKSISTLLDDPMFSICSAFFGVFPYNATRDELGLERFHQLSPSTLYLPDSNVLEGMQAGKRFTGGFQVGEECCSSGSISFHQLEPDELRTMHNMLYSCRRDLDEVSITPLSNPTRDICEDDVFGFAPVLSKVEVAPRGSGPKVLCFINSHEKYHSTRVDAVLKTWGNRCDKLVVASSKDDPRLGAVKINNTGFEYEDLWNKHRETLRYVYATYKDEYEWFLKADDDTYVIVENLKELLLSPSVATKHQNGVPMHIGSPIGLWVDEDGVRDNDGRTIHDKDLLARYQQIAGDKAGIFNDGGPGYAMNNVFLEKLMEHVDEKECFPSKAHADLLDDPLLSFCSILAFETYPSSARDDQGRERFHSFTPATLLHPGRELSEAWNGAKRFSGGFQYGEDCCSPKSISFHRMGPDEMRAAHDLLYTCRLPQVGYVSRPLSPSKSTKKRKEDTFGFAPVLDKIEIATLPPNAPKILCFVNTHEQYHETRVRAVLDTWGPACDKLVFVSSQDDETLDAVQINNTGYEYSDLWTKHRETLRYIYDTYKDEYDWFFKADDDTFTIVENLREYLMTPDIQKQHNSGAPLHIGNRNEFVIEDEYVYDGQGRTFLDKKLLRRYLNISNGRYIFNVGGAGYAMNRAFLTSMMEWIDRPECTDDRSVSTQLDDPLISFCSAFFGAWPYNTTREDSGRERFHQFSPSDLYNFSPKDQDFKDVSYLKRNFGGFKVGEECCSTKSITFHHMEPEQMYSAYDMLYESREESNRTLVVLWGSIRGGEPTWNSLYKHLLDASNADLALIIGDRTSKNSSLFERAKYIWEVVEHDNWSKAIDQTFGTTPKDHHSWRYVARHTSNGPFGATEEDPTSSGAIRGIFTFELAQKLLHLGLLDKYYRFVLTRTDQYYTVDLNVESFDEAKIWVPSGEDWNGICDRFFVAGRDHILAALNTHLPAIRNPRKYYDFRGNIETFVRRRWEEDGLFRHVRRFQRPMFSARVAGDVSRWLDEMKMAAFEEDGVRLNFKYVDEYYQAMSTRRNRRIVREALRIQTFSDVVVVLPVTTGKIDLVESWLRDTADIVGLHDKTLIIADETTYSHMKDWTTRATIVQDALSPLLQVSWDYNTRGYWRVKQHQCNIVQELLNAGVNFFWTSPSSKILSLLDFLENRVDSELVVTKPQGEHYLLSSDSIGFRATPRVADFWSAVTNQFHFMSMEGIYTNGFEDLEELFKPHATLDEVLTTHVSSQQMKLNITVVSTARDSVT